MNLLHKNYLAISFIAFITAGSLTAHEEPPKTLQEKDQKTIEANKIKELNLKTSTAWKIVNDVKTKHLETNYNQNGTIESMILYKSDETIETKVVYSYDNKGNMILDADYDASNNLVEKIEYTFDKKGRVTGSMNYEGEKLDSTFSYEFNKVRNTILFRKYNSSDELEYLIDYKYPGKADKTDVAEIKKYKLSGEIILTAKYKYYDGSSNVSEKTLYGPNNEFLYKFVYSYDTNDNRTQIIKEMSEEKIGFTQKFEYNSSDLCTRITVLNDKNELNYTLEYTYDYNTK